MFCHYEGKSTQNYTRTQIQALVELSESSKQKPFKQLTREDILSFLDKFRKTEHKDPLDKWIGTSLKRGIATIFYLAQRPKYRTKFQVKSKNNGKYSKVQTK